MPVEGRIDDQADRARIGGAVAELPASTVDWTGVHAGAAANAFQRRPELFHAKPCRPTIVDQHDVHLAAVAGPPKVRGVLGYQRAEGAARQHADEHRQVLKPRDDLLDADRGDVQLRHVRRQIGVSLVGADDKGPGLGHREIAPGHARIRVED
jgi:hypothetical protein